VGGASVFFASWPAKRILIFYYAPLTLAVSLWGRLRLLDVGRWTSRAMLIDGTVMIVAVTRFLSNFPPASGHMLFLTYSGLTIKNRGYQALAIVLIAETTYFKFVIWDDWVSWAIGGAAGLVAACLCSVTNPS
jgi:hypothetical protein